MSVPKLAFFILLFPAAVALSQAQPSKPAAKHGLEVFGDT